MDAPVRPRFRIGELARRTGVSPALLRAWETRYGLLRPSRSPGGFRLYSEEDEARVRRMRAHQREGLSAAEAARLTSEARAAPPPAADVPAAGLEEAARELRLALEGFDEAGAQAVLDRLLASLTLDSMLAGVVLPCLREIGARWERGEVSVAQEHFAANLVRGRLLALARGWGQGSGPRALLACAPDELHDLGLVCFGLALRARGWTITFLGPATPVDTLAETADRLDPELVVVSAASPAPLEAAAEGLRTLAARSPLALAGRGASARLAADVGAGFLADDPVAAADGVTAAPPRT